MPNGQYLGRRYRWDFQAEREEIEDESKKRSWRRRNELDTEWERGKSHMVECRLIKIWVNLSYKS